MKQAYTAFILDNDPVSSMILKSKLLQNLRLKVQTFRSDIETLQNFGGNPEIVILHQDRHEDSIKALNKMKCLNPKTRFIIISKAYCTQIQSEFINDNYTSYVNKASGLYSNRVKQLVDRLIFGFDGNQHQMAS